jgi:serine/threonine-protein phosphatase PGAM5
MLQGFDEKFGPCNIKTIRVSGMARAQETADIIAQNIPGAVHRSDPDPNLNEGRPCHHIPGGKASQRAVKQTDDSHDRIEKAFKTYFHRADPPLSEEEKEKEANKAVVVTSSSNGKVVEEDDEDEDESMELKPHPQHEFEIIVCHANVIRYFLCRALQIPPEAWLRLCTFNCSLTYLTVRPTGTVSCRMLGDIGHLGYEHSTFSMHHGFNW